MPTARTPTALRHPSTPRRPVRALAVVTAVTAAALTGLVATAGAAPAATTVRAPTTAAATAATNPRAAASPASAVPSVARPAAVLAAGTSLAPGASLPSGTGYALVMQPGGNLVEYGPGRVQWASRTHVAGSHLVLQPDGNLVVYGPTGTAVWASHTSGHPGSTLQVAAGGDVSVVAPTGAQLWDDQVGAARLAPTGRLTAGRSISSPDGGTTLSMGTDGNLVLRTLVAGVPVAVWSSRTAGHPGAQARMRADGVLAVYSRTNTVLWTATASPTAPVHLEVVDGGNARISGPGLPRIASLGDDYPAALRDAPEDSLVDPWLYYSRECVSFAAWRAVHTDGVDVYHAGNANAWASWARKHGYVVDRRPAPGSIAWTDAGRFGHVAVVELVVGTDLVVEEYNYGIRGEYAHRVVPASAFKAFLHLERPANPVAAPASSTAAAGTTAGR